MRVLKYENRKCPVELFDISTPEKEEAAYRLLFRQLDKDWNCYCDLSEEEEPALCTPCKDGQHKYCKGEDGCTCSDTPECKERNWRRRSAGATVRAQRALYEKALTGDVVAIKRLMKARHDYEYEETQELEVTDPIAAMLEAVEDD